MERISRSKKCLWNFLLTDLSKAFDCLTHELVIAKLCAHGVDMSSLKLTFIYLKEDYGLKLMMFIAHGLKYILSYLRTLFLVHYYSIYSYLTFSCSYPNMGLLFTLMIIPHTQQVTEFTTLYLI